MWSAFILSKLVKEDIKQMENQEQELNKFMRLRNESAAKGNLNLTQEAMVLVILTIDYMNIMNAGVANILNKEEKAIETMENITKVLNSASITDENEKICSIAHPDTKGMAESFFGIEIRKPKESNNEDSK